MRVPVRTAPSRRAALMLCGGVPAAFALGVSSPATAVGAGPTTGTSRGTRPRPSGEWVGDWPEKLRRAVVAAVPAAVDEAKRASAPFAAVLVDRAGGHITAAAANTTEGGDQTRHAEMNLLSAAVRAGIALPSQVLVSTAEPCAMCAGAILWSGTGAVAFGTTVATMIDLGIPQIDVSLAELVGRWPRARPPLGMGIGAELTDPLYRAFAESLPSARS